MKKVLCIIVALVLTMAVAFALVGCKKKGSDVSEFDKQFQGNYKEATVEQAQAYLDKIEQFINKADEHSDGKAYVLDEESSTENDDKWTWELHRETSGSLKDGTLMIHGAVSEVESYYEDGSKISWTDNEEAWGNLAEMAFYQSITNTKTVNGKTESSTEKRSGIECVESSHNILDPIRGYFEPYRAYSVVPDDNIGNIMGILEGFIADGEYVTGDGEHRVYLDGNKCKIVCAGSDEDGEWNIEFYCIVEENRIASKRTSYYKDDESTDRMSTIATFELCPQTITMPNPADYPAKQD